MKVVKKIKTLLQEAELYHSQGLLDEAMGKYRSATELIQSNDQLKGKQNLIDGVYKKIIDLKEDIKKIEKAPQKPEVSPKIQDLIKKMVSFSADQDEDTKALDGAIGLAKFGQFKRALLEFNELLKKDSLRVVAAKSIIRCHLALSSVDDAVTQYEQWLSSDIFIPSQLDKLRVFFENILKREGIERTLPQVIAPLDDIEHVIEIPEIDGRQIQESYEEELGIEEIEIEGLEIEDDEVVDINSIGITLDSGPKEGEVVEFKVNFQLGNVITLLIPSRDKDLIENFKVGATINNIQYYTNIALFNGTGVVSAVKEIKVGPLRGDYCVDIEVRVT